MRELVGTAKWRETYQAPQYLISFIEEVEWTMQRLGLPDPVDAAHIVTMARETDYPEPGKITYKEKD